MHSRNPCTFPGEREHIPRQMCHPVHTTYNDGRSGPRTHSLSRIQYPEPLHADSWTPNFEAAARRRQGSDRRSTAAEGRFDDQELNRKGVGAGPRRVNQTSEYGTRKCRPHGTPDHLSERRQLFSRSVSSLCNHHRLNDSPPRESELSGLHHACASAQPCVIHQDWARRVSSD